MAELMDVDTPEPHIQRAESCILSDGSDVLNYIVAFDFGTTYSSVSYVGYTHASQLRRIGLHQIETISGYPAKPYLNAPVYDVPTELWYFSRIPRPPCSQTSLASRPVHVNDLDSDESEDENDDITETPSPLAQIEEVEGESNLATNDGHTNPHISWGYEVQEQQSHPVQKSDISRHLSRFKLMLDESDHTESVRNKLIGMCENMKKMWLINESNDIIADYLEQLCRHTKKKLAEYGGYTSASKVEFVLCIPAIWKVNARLAMQKAMCSAVERSGFGSLQNGGIDNLFLVSEPEAAAACLLASNVGYLKFGDTFLILDAGGGTVDAVVYTIDNAIVLRLKQEAVLPDGDLCGSSYVNEAFERLLNDRLKGEDYLEQEGKTIPQIIDSLVVEFERVYKGKLDRQFPGKLVDTFVDIPGLRQNKKKKFHPGKLILTPRDIGNLFRPLFRRVAALMKSQLLLAQEKKLGVKKVVLMGGFGQSVGLRAHLEDVLVTDQDLLGSGVSLGYTNLQSTAVSRGAVLRALRKQDGPERFVEASYGFLRGEPYDEENPAHVIQGCNEDTRDGHKWIEDTIVWVINKGDRLPFEQRFSRKVEYLFKLGTTKMYETVYLFVSDLKHESHYRFDHEMNRGAQVEGTLQLNFSKLRKRKQLTAEPPKVPGKMPYWNVKATLVMIVSGRNLRYEVWYPDENGRLEGSGQVSIAAAFTLGTE